MPQVNLSTLSGPELRRLLDSTRQRGEAAMSYRILQEMAARREANGHRIPFRKRRPAEQRTIAIDLGDPMGREDDLPPMPLWRPPSSAPKASISPSPGAVPGPAPRGSRRKKPQPDPPPAAPIALAHVEPTPLRLETGEAAVLEPTLEAANDTKDWGVEAPAPQLQNRRKPPRLRRAGIAAGVAVGMGLGFTLGWWLAGIARQAPPPPAASRPAVIQTAALARPPASPPVSPPAPAAPTAAEAEPAPEAPSDPAVGAQPSDHEAAPTTTPAATEVAREATGVAMELPAATPERSKPEPVRIAQADTCAAEPTPADRTICGDPELQGLQRELRQAYARALEAHEDRTLLRQRQLAWRDARSAVTEPDRLAQLYVERIRKLNAATAAARMRH